MRPQLPLSFLTPSCIGSKEGEAEMRVYFKIYLKSEIYDLFYETGLWTKNRKVQNMRCDTILKFLGCD